MTKNQQKNLRRGTIFILLSILLFFLSYNAYRTLPYAGGLYSLKRKLLLSTFWILFFLIWLGSLFALIRPKHINRWKEKIIKFPQKGAWYLKTLSILFLCFPSLFFSLTPFGRVIDSIYLRLFIYLSSTLIAAALMTEKKNKLFSFSTLMLCFITSATLLIVAKEYRFVRSHPFSLYWSEGNRLWDYSTFWDSQRYNYPPSQEIYSLTGPGRRSLWGLPFLIPGVPIWGVRLWSSIVFTVPYVLLGCVLFKKSENNKKVWGLLGLWTLLFLTQGPIYTPLVLSGILVAGTRKQPLWIAIPLVILAGYYAQWTRYTWMFAPAMWAGMWTLGRGTVNNNKTVSKVVWAQSILLVLAGILGGYLIPYFLNAKNTSVVSIEGASQVITKQPLIWSRLCPNPTYPPGILIGLLLAVGPLLILLITMLVTKRWLINIWQGLALGGGLLAFLVVGLIVSVKMGGGSNLHNMDMFLIGVLFTAAIAWEKGGAEWLNKLDFSSWHGIVLLAVVAIPAYFSLLEIKPLDLPDRQTTQATLQRIQKEVSLAAEEGEVLFMDQRQLMTFDYVEQVPLIVEYEKKVVMNKAKSADEEYFAKFYQDLAEHRFALIINEPLKTRYKEEGEYNFAAENNAWVYWIAEPMLCYYEKLVTFEEFRVELLVPREGKGNCPLRFPSP